MTTVVSGMDGPIDGPSKKAGLGLRGRPEVWPDPALFEPVQLDARLGERPRSPWRGGLAVAGRHSAFVSFLRRTILAGCAGAIALVALAAFLNPLRTLAPDISIGQVGFDGTKVTLDAPKISGFQKDQRPYAIKARKGIQDLAAPSIVELLDIEAEIGTADAETIRVLASRAVYNSLADHLLLEGDVHIANTGGYDAAMQAASIDFKQGSLISDAPVRVRLDGGLVAADRMAITDHGHKVSFEGKVRSVIDAKAGADGSQASAAPGT